MNCRYVDALVNFESDDARPDPAALDRHVATCSRCRDRYPEIAGLFALRAASPLLATASRGTSGR